MTYWQFLSLFVGLPTLAVLSMLILRRNPGVTNRGWIALAAHVFLAVAYTTPWDNYLVHSRVWWYPAGRVWGLTLGWVPLEEYLFFVFQTLLTGGLVLLLSPNEQPRSQLQVNASMVRRLAVLTASAVAVLAFGLLLGGNEQSRYLSLILAWALPPIVLQFAFGFDILLQRWQSVGAAIALPTLYLSLADRLAIQDGIWTISLRYSTGLGIGGLPVEEALFFLMTNCLVVFGMTFIMESSARARARSMMVRIVQTARMGRGLSFRMKPEGEETVS